MQPYDIIRTSNLIVAPVMVAHHRSGIKVLRRYSDMNILAQNKTGVYAIVFHTDHGDMIYVGSTSRSFTERFGKHRCQLNNHTHHNPKLQRYWDKYSDVVEFQILETCDNPSILLKMEQSYIERINKDHLLNCGPAFPNPMAGRHQSDEAKRKLSLCFKGRKHTQEAIEKIRLSQLGRPKRPHTEESKKKMSISQKGRKHSSETKERISKGNKGKFVSGETREKLRQINIGKKAAPETRAKMSLSQSKRKHPLETKKKMSETQRRIRNDPAGHEKRADAAKKSWETRRLHQQQKGEEV
jgi:group I intron endonuclease